MKVKVLPGKGTVVCNEKNYLPGDTLEIEDSEGKRLINLGIAEAVSEQPSDSTDGEGEDSDGEGEVKKSEVEVKKTGGKSK